MRAPTKGATALPVSLQSGDADLIMMPIRRRLVAFYTVQPVANFTLKTERGLRVRSAPP
jgi:hypothetical protein